MQNIRVVKNSSEKNNVYEIAITNKTITVDDVFSAAIVSMLHYPADVLICPKPLLDLELNTSAEETWLVFGHSLIILLWSERNVRPELNDSEVLVINNTPIELIHKAFDNQLKKLLQDETARFNMVGVETEEDLEKLDTLVKFAVEMIRSTVFNTVS